MSGPIERTMLCPITDSWRSEGLSRTYDLTSSARRDPQVSMPSSVCALPQLRP